MNITNRITKAASAVRRLDAACINKISVTMSINLRNNIRKSRARTSYRLKIIKSFEKT